jgi:hypothetical protein
MKKLDYLKLNKKKNVWYDHGTGNRGTFIDFATQFSNCDVQTVLEKISKYVSGNSSKLSSQINTNNIKLPDA